MIMMKTLFMILIVLAWGLVLACCGGGKQRVPPDTEPSPC
jgi:hypothetical protein